MHLVIQARCIELIENPVLKLMVNPFYPCLLTLLTALLNTAGVGLVNSIGAGLPGGQSNNPNLNPPNQIDPSSIERAYAALGLTYQGNQMPQQASQPNMPNQGLQGQPGMRALNSMGKRVAHIQFSVTRNFLNTHQQIV